MMAAEDNGAKAIRKQATLIKGLDEKGASTQNNP